MKETLELVIIWLKKNKEGFKIGFDADRRILLNNSLEFIKSNLPEILSQKTNQDLAINISELSDIIVDKASYITKHEAILTADSYHACLVEALGNVYIEEYIE